MQALGQVQRGLREGSEGSGEGLGGFGAELWRRASLEKVPEKDPKVLEEVWEALVQSQVRFNRVPEKVPEKPGSTGFRGSFPEKVSEVLVQTGSTGFQRRFPEKVWEALVQSQVKFNRVPEKVPESQVRFKRVPEKVPEKVAEKIL